MHQRNKGKKFFKEFCCLLASLSCLIFLSVMNPMEFVYDSQITTCSKNHPHRKPNYGGTAFLVVSNHLHNKKTTIFNKIFAANSQDVWEIYSCEKMRISQAQHEDFTNCQTSTQKWRQMLVNNWAISFWIFAILKNVQKSNVRKNVSFAKPFLPYSLEL